MFKDFPVAYGCANGYVRLLRPASGLVKTLGAHGDKAAVTHVAVGGGGINVVVVSAAIDGTIKVGRNVMVDFIYSLTTCMKRIQQVAKPTFLM